MTNDSAAAEKAVIEAVQAHPELGAILCDDEVGLAAANASRRALPERKYLVAGYYSGKNNLPNFMQGHVAALGERSIETLVRRAMRLAVDRADGKEAPAKVVVDIPIRRGNRVPRRPKARRMSPRQRPSPGRPASGPALDQEPGPRSPRIGPEAAAQAVRGEEGAVI